MPNFRLAFRTLRKTPFVTAIASKRLPLAFVTNGHVVPDHLEEASPRGLAALLLRSGFRSELTRESHP